MPKRSSTPIVVAITVLLAVLAFRFLPRYEVRANTGWVYRIDRWTGSVKRWNSTANLWVELKDSHLDARLLPDKP